LSARFPTAPGKLRRVATSEERQTSLKRRIAKAFWRIFNPLAIRLAGIAPWWVVLETIGRKSGEPRRTPFARGPVDGNVAWVIAVHGAHSDFAHNIAADPNVRFRLRGRWHTGTASLVPMDPAVVERFTAYARSGPVTVGIDPMLIRVELVS
jgi:deazaflavin-dependent oxidoreductase (nitroreductase family)